MGRDKKALRVGCAAGLVLAMSTALPAGEDATAAFHRLLEEDWSFRLREDPLFATQVGEHSFNDRLPSLRAEDHRRRDEHRRDLLRRLRSIDPAALGESDRVSYRIFERLTADAVAEYEFRTHLMPITGRTGFHVSFPQLPREVPLNTVADYESYIARLGAFERYAAEHIELMREGIRLGFTLPAPVLVGWEGAVDPHIVEDASESLLFVPFEKLPDRIDDEQRRRLTRAGEQAIRRSVVPGYRAFRRFMEQEYVPAARETIGASALPRGKELYEHRVRRFTTLDVTPEEVYRTGRAEVRRIRGEMERVIQRVGFEGEFSEFLEFLRTDERFYVDTAEALMEKVSRVLKRMDGELPRLFRTLPRMPYGILPVPEFIAPRTTTAYYERPAGDGTRAGVYRVNTYDLRSRPLYELEALSLHEAVPGHHLQIALQQELEGLPPFRRFSGATAFVEGWALYAERLGLEAGFYQDPYSDFGRLTYEMWRACRLVVDTGIHAMGWTQEEAIDFMARNTALTELNIANEVDRYIAWPGQALAYKMGELKIRELRRRAERDLGSRFDVREFHGVVLGSGAVPLSVLEDQVRRYIEAAAARGPRGGS